MADRPTVTRSSLPHATRILAPALMTALPTRIWTSDEWQRIQCGYRARDKDENWDVFVEDHTAYIHRSWSGTGIFEATLSPAGEGWQITAGTVESDPDLFRSPSDLFNRVTLELVLRAVILDEPTSDLRAQLAAMTAPLIGRAQVLAPAAAEPAEDELDRADDVENVRVFDVVGPRSAA